MTGIVNRTGARTGIIGQTELEYEEGSWTPTDPTSNVINGSAIGGHYMRIGNIVHITMMAEWTDTDNDTNVQVNIGNLPFVPSDVISTTGADYSGPVVLWRRFSQETSMVCSYVSPDSIMRFTYTDSGGDVSNTYLYYGGIDQTANLRTSLTYFINQ